MSGSIRENDRDNEERTHRKKQQEKKRNNVKRASSLRTAGKSKGISFIMCESGG